MPTVSLSGLGDLEWCQKHGSCPGLGSKERQQGMAEFQKDMSPFGPGLSVSSRWDHHLQILTGSPTAK